MTFNKFLHNRWNLLNYYRPYITITSLNLNTTTRPTHISHPYHIIYPYVPFIYLAYFLSSIYILRVSPLSYSLTHSPNFTSYPSYLFPHLPPLISLTLPHTILPQSSLIHCYSPNFTSYLYYYFLPCPLSFSSIYLVSLLRLYIYLPLTSITSFLSSHTLLSLPHIYISYYLFFYLFTNFYLFCLTPLSSYLQHPSHARSETPDLAALATLSRCSR